VSTRCRSFDLAKRLKKAPRKIAEEIVAGGRDPGFEKLEVAGAG
jgi:arginyl-tRNA synthetase